MPKYNVTFPIAGHVYIEVEADSEKEAIEKAPDVWANDPDDSCISWEFHYGCKGNVCSFPSPWKPEAEESE